MSFGLVCLNCRKYLVVGRPAQTCQCEEPVPTWDLKKPAGEQTLPDWLRPKIAVDHYWKCAGCGTLYTEGSCPSCGMQTASLHKDTRKCSLCRTWFSCGRKHSFPSVDHSQDDCELSYLDCIQAHYHHECGHDFTSGPVVEGGLPGGGYMSTSSCACGLTSAAHDMMHSP